MWGETEKGSYHDLEQFQQKHEVHSPYGEQECLIAHMIMEIIALHDHKQTEENLKCNSTDYVPFSKKIKGLAWFVNIF